MANEEMLGRGNGFSDPVTGAGCPAVMNALNAGVVCCRVDEGLSFCWGNARFFGMTGYAEAEFSRRFAGLRPFYAASPECAGDFAALENALSRAMKAGETGIEMDIRLPKKTGGFSGARLSGTVSPGETGVPLLVAVLTDRGALAAGREEQARLAGQHWQYFRWMMDEFEGNVYACDMETYELLYLNRTSCETLGVPADRVLGRKCFEVIQGRQSPCPFCTNDRLRENGFYNWEFFNPVLERTFLIKNRIIEWEGRQVRLELSHDMFSTEYKLAKKDRERLALVRSMPGGFARLDARDYRTVLWYGADFLNVIGYTAEQFENELHSQCGYVHPDDLERITAQLKKVETTGRNVVTEARIITRSGKTKYLNMTLCYARAEDSWDGIPSVYSVGMDVTEQREEEARQRQALEDAYHAARVASEAKTNFLSSMSHDIRTPMNAIMGMAVIAQANLASPERVRDCLGKINVSSRHLLSLINEILDMSKIESGKIDLVAETVSLPELVQNALDMCQPLLREKRQEFHVSASRVEHEKIVTDGGRLQQVLMNLLSNAVKYTPEGGTVSLLIRELPTEVGKRGQYEFVVEDNGIGMSPSFLPHLFEPFSRAEDARISRIQGTGLGMAITENIVRMMNGTIAVESELEKGSRFTVSLPFELAGEEEMRETALEGLPVLVVDDDRTVCESATALLNELGMRGSWVDSGEEALRCVVCAHESGNGFFAVILDWKMPGMNGLDTLKAIRKELGPDIPVIVISAYDYSDIEEEFRKAGANAFISKPLFKSKMLHVLQFFCLSAKNEAIAPLPGKPGPTLEGRRLLLVEDNDMNREIAMELLGMYGMAVDAAENGLAALEKFRDSPAGTYDGILMDVQMPVMNGYEATRAIRALDREDAKAVPILALTANAFATDIGKAHAAGMNDHVSKPIDIAYLVGILQKWIR